MDAMDFHTGFPTQSNGPGDDVGVRFPPGLGIIPPRDVPRLPRARRGAEMAA